MAIKSMDHNRCIMPSQDKKPDWRKQKPDWHELPNEIAYLRPYADKYGIIQFEEKIERYYQTIASDELDELRAINKRTKKDWKTIDKYIKDYFVTKDTPRSE